MQLHASGAAFFSWTPVTGLSCTNCNNPSVIPTNNINYTVQAIDNFNCTGSDTLSLTVIHPFNITAINDTICRGDSARLTANGANYYSWTPAAGLNNSSVSSPHASPAFTTMYTVIGSDGWNCFTDTAYSLVAVGQPLSVNLGDNLSLQTGTLYHFQPIVQNGPVSSWSWTPSTELSCTSCADPFANIIKDITYTVMVHDIYGCTAMDNIVIRTFCDNSQVFIPNAFSPDGDGVNDILMVRGKGIR